MSVVRPTLRATIQIRRGAMLRRVVEGVLVAVVASAVTWAASHPDDSAGAADVALDRTLSSVATYGSPFHSWLWLVAIALVVIGLALHLWALAPLSPRTSGEWSVVLPSVPTTLIGIGVALGLISHAVGLAAEASAWALPVLALVVFWAYRWLDAARYRLSRMTGVL